VKIVELHGVNYGNKGAQLMMYATVQALATLPEPCRCAVSFRQGTFAQRKADGLLHLMIFQRPSRQALNGALEQGVRLLPQILRNSAGFVLRSDTMALLDASGFAYSDQWEPKHLDRMCQWAKQLESQKKPLIFLPQAFGPFRTSVARDRMKEILDRATLVFARDRISYAHLEELGGPRANLQIAPDITNLVQPSSDPALRVEPDTLFIVPNSRMIDKTASAESARFVPGVMEIARRSQQLGYRPVVLIHDSVGDAELGRELRRLSGGTLPVLTGENPLRLKALLSRAGAVVGSRYHALIGALSSGTPTVSMGWSHKYSELMEEYGCPEADASVQEVDRIVELLASWRDVSKRQSYVERLKARANLLKEQSAGTWEKVAKVIRR
jgi:colanic acid/amylovoran biosynthesis protein